MLNAQTLQEISNLLMPLLGSDAERRANLIYAFGTDSPLLSQIDYTGAVDTFVNNLAASLEHFGETTPGKPALWTLLDALRDKVGTDRKQRIDALRPVFKLPPERLPDRCFVSYSRKDEPFALRLVSDLTDAGLRVWFDRYKIKGGEAWWQSIEGGIQNADFVIFCLSPDSAGSEVANREIQMSRTLGKRVIPIMVAPVLDLLRESTFTHIAWLTDIHVIDFSQAMHYGIAFQELLGALPGYNPPDPYFDLDPTDIPNPFRGLEAFREIDYHYFSGREAEIRELLDRIRLSPPAPSQGEGKKAVSRLLAVVGASGSGKSSLVRAGLIPALRQEKNELALWETATFAPGKEPLKALAERLALRTEIPALTLHDTLMRPNGLHDIVTEIMRGKPDGAHFLLVVDQFEEVFTQATEGDRKALIEVICHAATVEAGKTQIALTMRADFFDRLGAHPAIAGLIEDNLFIAKDIQPDALRRSIEMPARKVGLVYDDGLVDMLLESVREQPGSLPLLQYALKELYERRIGRKLTQQAYADIGGVQGALATHADALYNSLDEAQKVLMKRVLLRLIEVGEETVTRRRVVRDELRFKDVPENAEESILDRLTAQESRLLVATAPVGDKDQKNDAPIFYEVSHEALITHWTRLAGWVNDNRAQLRLESDLRRIAANWQTEANPQKQSDYLLRGVRLDEAQAWLRAADVPTPAQQAFIEASICNQAEIIAAEQQRIADLNAAIHQARRTRTRLLITTVFAAIMITVAIVVAYFGFRGQESAVTRENQANAAVAIAAQTLTPVPAILASAEARVTEGQRKVENANATLTRISVTLTHVAEQVTEGEVRLREVESQRLAAQAQALLDGNGNSELAALLGIRALKTTFTNEAEEQLNRAVERLYGRGLLAGHRQPINGVLVLADGRFLSWSDDGTLRLWMADGTPLKTLEGHRQPISGALVLAGGRFLSWSEDNTLRLWAPDGTSLKSLEGHTSKVTGALELRDGRLISWADRGDESLRLWAADGTFLKTLEGHTNYVLGALELKDGNLLSWSYDLTLRLWRSDGTLLSILEDPPDDGICDVRLLTDGRFLSWIHPSWGADDRIRLWTADGALQYYLEGHTDIVLGVQELADGNLVSWSQDKTMRLWATDGTSLRVLNEQDQIDNVLALADGRFLSWSYDSSLRLWAADGSPLYTLTGHAGVVRGARELADGRLLTWSDDSTLHLWTSDGTALSILTGHTGGVRGTVELTDGRLLSWSGDATLRLWSGTGTPLQLLKGHQYSVDEALELADGRLLTWGDTTIRLWASDGSPIKVLESYSHYARGALELADGRLLTWGDNTIRLWGRDGTPLKALDGDTTMVGGVLELVDGRLLSWAGNTLQLWAADGTLLNVLKGHTKSVGDVLVLSDGRFLSRSGDTTLRLWSADGSSLQVLEGHADAVTGMLELKDGRFLSWSTDKTLRLWAADGTFLNALEGSTGIIRGALELTDGRMVSWSQFDRMRLWDSDGSPLTVPEAYDYSIWSTALEDLIALTNGQLLAWGHSTLQLWAADGTLLRSLEKNTGMVWGALALMDGQFLTWSDEGTLYLWAADGALRKILEGHNEIIQGVLALSDGRFLSWSNDSTLRLWYPATAQLTTYACSQVFRDFTAEERSRFTLADDEPTCP